MFSNVCFPILQVIGDFTKNHREDSEDIRNQGLILDHENICNQYRIIELFMKLLNPKLDRLWQMPKLQTLAKILHNFDVQVLFDARPLGKMRAYNCLQSISDYCGIKHYTGHCVRATGITLLCRAGYDQNTISKLTGMYLEIPNFIMFCLKFWNLLFQDTKTQVA